MCSGGVFAMAVISLKLTEALDVQLTDQAHRRRLSKSELVRRALTAFLQQSRQDVEGSATQSAADLVADLVGCCEDGPADLSSNPAYLSEFGAN
jgi:Arc/MetJ-type ribon-helix-helix transcriptional regulator